MSRTAPRSCPVCGEGLAVTRLSCAECNTELSGEFAHCEFCALDAQEREMLRVFLASRGNMKEIERHLGVSYPTARARFDELMKKVGVKTDAERSHEVEILERLARGEIDVDEALGDLR